ncbi:hypothetical protein GCM10020229_48620 [Kitasatospora albolonga]
MAAIPSGTEYSGRIGPCSQTADRTENVPGLIVRQEGGPGTSWGQGEELRRRRVRSSPPPGAGRAVSARWSAATVVLDGVGNGPVAGAAGVAERAGADGRVGRMGLPGGGRRRRNAA